jgi:hypothetical protein
MFNEGNQILNFMSSSGSRTVIYYGSGSGSDFLTSYGSGSGSTSQKATVPTVPVPVPQHCVQRTSVYCRILLQMCARFAFPNIGMSPILLPCLRCALLSLLCSSSHLLHPW